MLESGGFQFVEDVLQNKFDEDEEERASSISICVEVMEHISYAGIISGLRLMFL